MSLQSIQPPGRVIEFHITITTRHELHLYSDRLHLTMWSRKKSLDLPLSNEINSMASSMARIASTLFNDNNWPLKAVDETADANGDGGFPSQQHQLLLLLLLLFLCNWSISGPRKKKMTNNRSRKGSRIAWLPGYGWPNGNIIPNSSLLSPSHILLTASLRKSKSRELALWHGINKK